MAASAWAPMHAITNTWKNLYRQHHLMANDLYNIFYSFTTFR